MEARADGFVFIAGDVSARRAVEVVVAHEDRYFGEVVVAAERGHRALYEVAGRMRASLALTGREYAVEEVEDALWMVVRELWPNTPAAAPDVARVEALLARAESYVREHDPDGALGKKERAEHEICALDAIKRHDLPGLRAALRDLCRAARDAARAGRDSEAS